MYFFWILKHYLFLIGKRKITQASVVLSLCISMSLILISSSLMSGYEASLEKTIRFFYGDIVIYQGFRNKISESKLRNKYPDLFNQVKDLSFFLEKEAFILKNNQVVPLKIYGLDFSKKHNQKLLIDIKSFESDKNFILLGKSLSKKLNLFKDEKLQFFFPSPDGSLKKTSFIYHSSYDFKRHDYNTSFALLDIKSLKKHSSFFASGLKMILKDPSSFEKVSDLIKKNQYFYSSLSWRDFNLHLFEAISWEKKIIFLIIFILLLVAGFNLFTHLLIDGKEAFFDLSILRSMGLQSSFFFKFFMVKSLWMAFLSFSCALVLSYLFKFFLSFFKSRFSLLPAEVYKLEDFNLVFSFWDIFLIGILCFLICFVFCLFPAYKMTKTPLLKALRNE